MLKRFYDRTTRWMNEQQKDWLLPILFLDEVNIRTLRLLLGDEDKAKAAFQWFEGEGSVRDTTGSSFRVRQYLRSRLLDYVKTKDPDRYEDLSLKGKEATHGQLRQTPSKGRVA